MKVVHDKYAKDVDLREEVAHQFDQAVEYNKDLKPFVGRVQDDLNPLRVLWLFQNITSEVRLSVKLCVSSSALSLHFLTHLPLLVHFMLGSRGLGH